jgi:SAM-dependent methyltransferase
MECHEYQRLICSQSGRPILNVGCKEDPTDLGNLFDAINVDRFSYDPHTGTDLSKKVKNFIKADARRLPWTKPTFATVVIGELLEHCQPGPAKDILLEAKRVLLDDGIIVITFPLDTRPPREQHAPHLLMMWDEGITSWHSSVWSDDRFLPLIEEVGLRQREKTPLSYPFLPNANPQGYGVVLVRPMVQ